MAVYPCDWSAHRYPSAQQSIYFTKLWGSEPETCKMRLCPRHFDEMMQRIRERMTSVEEDQVVGTVCEHCDEPKGGTIFAKAFPMKAEPEYYATDVCAQCWFGIGIDLHIANARLMTGR